MVGIIRIPLDTLKQQILEKGNLSAEELESRIKQKMDVLSGLISQEGACHIIANELGIKVFEAGVGKLPIKSILEGMRSVEAVGKVMQKYEVREFSVSGRQGKVGSMIIADETGSIRVVLWNNQTEHLGTIKEGDIVKISNAYVRNNIGKKELHLNERSDVDVNPEGETVGEVRMQERVEATRKQIKELTEQDRNVEVLGTIVQAFDPHFFEVCPQCFKRVREQEGNFRCGEHGEVTPSHSAVMNLFLDDGTENIRAVFFRNQLANLLGKSQEELLGYKDNIQAFEQVKHDLLGKIIKVVGRVNRNEMFDRLEFTANLVYPDPNPDEEIKKLDEAIAASIEQQGS